MPSKEAMSTTDPASSTPPANNLRQPKKRFVGRRTAEAQTQKETSQDHRDVESTVIQKGESFFFPLCLRLDVQEIK